MFPLSFSRMLGAIRLTFRDAAWIAPAAVLAALAVLFAWTAYDKYRLVHQERFRLLDAQASYAELQFAVAMRELADSLGEIADEHQEEDADYRAGSTPDEWLPDYLDNTPGVAALWVADAQGKVLVTTDKALGTDVSGSAYFKARRDPASLAGMHLSPPMNVAPGLRGAVFSLAIDADDDEDGEFAGVVAALVDQRYFAKVLHKLDAHAAASVALVVNEQGETLYRRGAAEADFGRSALADYPALATHFAAGAAPSRQVGAAGSGGEVRLSVTRRIAGSGLSVMLDTPRSEVLADWWRDLQSGALVFLAIAAMMFHLTRLAQRRQSELEANALALREAKESAENANHAKSHFLAAASHDLRQPLHALALLVAVLKRRYNDPASLKLIRPIEDAARALKELLDALLDISRLDAGVVVPQMQIVAVNELFTRLTAEFGVQAENRGLRLRVRHCGQAFIHSDPTLLMELLRNLLANACRYTEHGGILLACRQRGEMLAIQVWDSGPGIPAEEIGNIFREYYQVGNRERDRRKGLGLGLSIVERLAHLLGATIRVRSRVGRGSLFEVRLPIEEAPLATPCEPVVADAEVLHATVLVIDDDPLILDSTATLLELLGFHPVAAKSAADALDKLGSERPDAILADYRLAAGNTGIAAIAAIHARFGADIPALLVSGDTHPQRLREAKESGFELLHKPVEPEELDGWIRRTLKNVAPIFLST